MGKWQIDLDLDELWPPASELVGLQFATAADFARCRAILWEHPDSVVGMDAEARYVVVRKRDAHLFAEAGLAYTWTEFADPIALTPQERYELERAMIDAVKPRFRQRLRGEP